MTASVRPLLSAPRPSSVNDVGGLGDGETEGSGELDATGDAEATGEAIPDGATLGARATDGDGDGAFEPQAPRMPAIRTAAAIGARRLPLVDPATAGILAGRNSGPIGRSSWVDRSSRPTDGPLPDWIQRAFSAIALVLVAPLLFVIAIAVRIDTRGPALFAARRVGERGHAFTAWKFRTMRVSSDRASRISGPADPRITRLGAVLRRTRLDELPQLWNVVRGGMRLVGPRPEGRAFVEPGDPRWAAIMALRPGITGLAQLAFHDEAAALDPADPERSYRETVLPRKLAVDGAYAERRSAGLDVRIAIATLRVVAAGRGADDLVDEVVGNGGWRLPRGDRAD
jgi:lipopolysaccharide/colanic/teichoic acid biosynthesis glycosyltransferase